MSKKKLSTNIFIIIVIILFIIIAIVIYFAGKRMHREAKRHTLLSYASDRKSSGPHTDPTHSAIGKWRLFPNVDYKLHLRKIIPLIRAKTPSTIYFKEIAWKGKYNPEIKMKNHRYRDADTSFPGILVKNAPNPEHLPYRMIDGAHRITKMVNSQ